MRKFKLSDGEGTVLEVEADTVEFTPHHIVFKGECPTGWAALRGGPIVIAFKATDVTSMREVTE